MISKDKKRTPKNRVFTVLRYLLAAIPIVYIFGRMDLQEISTSLSQIAPWAIPFIMISAATAIVLQGIKAWYLTHALIPDLSFSTAMRFHFIGCFYSVALPTSAAQDVIRAVLIGRTKSKASAWAAVWIHKISGLLATLLVSISAFGLFLRSSFPLEMSRVLPLSALLILLAFVVSFSKRVTTPVRKLLERILPERILRPIASGREAIYAYKTKLPTLAGALLFSLCIQYVLILGSAVSAFGLTGKFFPFEFMAFIPLIELALMVVPLTPNGLGLREGLTALFFARLGFSPEETGIYLALSFLSVLVKLAGGFALFWKPSSTVSTKQDSTTIVT